ncbi:MAG: response regulator transcription factor [Clostridia bacterium]|nr:response regulator transcription factor [Clostridia bacterium]
MNKHKIFVVEDDRSISGLYEIAFDSEEFEVECFERAEDMFRAFEKQEKCDIIILDLMLPGMNGLDALKLLKAGESTKSIPIIIVSAKGDEKDKVEGLNLGADDYIAKPFGMLELIARVKANIRKSTLAGGEIISVGEITVNNAEHRVLVAGNEVQLTLKEYKLLKLLMERCDNVVTREKILTAVWDYEYFGETRTLDMHIKSLRSKLAQFTEAQYIHTVRGVGYKFSKNK